MIKSMTGFGKAEVAIPDKKITVEIRTLNSKQLDLAVKLPSAYRPLEYEIRALAAKALQRGKADLYISVESTARQTRACIDEELFHLYYNQLLKICREQPEIGTPAARRTMLSSSRSCACRTWYARRKKLSATGNMKP
jgi:uncharacterized protein (TIGR00255 family)